jgi:O-antigen ligase
MPTLSLTSIKKLYFKNKLKLLELIFLSLFLTFLPTFEAPKNIFLIFFIIIALYRQIKFFKRQWGLWDLIFISLIVSAFISALLPGVSGGDEWSGFRGILVITIFGWTIFGAHYSHSEKVRLTMLALFATIPPLVFGLFKLYVFHTKNYLEINSVGHVNHSATYICIIFGVTLAFLLFKQKNMLINRFAMFFLSIFLLLGILISQSRIIAFISIFLIIFLIILSKQSKKIKLSLMFFLILICMSVIYFKLPIVEKQLTYQKNHSFISARDMVWRTSIEISRINPILGIGNGNWKNIGLNDIRSSIEARGEPFYPEKYSLKDGHPHNIYLAYLVDRGIIGILTFLIFLFFWLKELINSLKNLHLKRKNNFLAFNSFVAWVVIFIGGIFNTTFQHENALLALFFLGLHLSFLRQKNQLKLFKWRIKS